MSDYTVKELKDIARDKGIKGFSTMSKSDLVKALKAEGHIGSPKRSAGKRGARRRSATKRSAGKRSPKRSAGKRSPAKRSAGKRGARRRSATKRSAGKRASPVSVKKAIMGDFKKMLKGDLIKLIKKIDASIEVKATMKKEELLHIVEPLLAKVAQSQPASPATGLDALTVAELKKFALESRGWKVGSMTKEEIINKLSHEPCNVGAGQFCSNASDTCDMRYNSCATGEVKGKGLEEIVIDGHKVVGTSKSISELKKKLGPAGPAVAPIVPLEQTLAEITRGAATTREFRENLERLKACLGLSPN